MNREFFDWEQDPELSTNSKIINIPLSEDQKIRRTFDALTDGYHYSENGLLQKTIELNKNNSNVIYYDPSEIKIDSKGRKFFISDEGNKIYIDDLGNAYGIRYDLNGQNEEEFLVLKSKSVLVFVDSSHRVGIMPDGAIYEYNEESKSYVYNPNIILHPNSSFMRK